MKYTLIGILISIFMFFCFYMGGLDVSEPNKQLGLAIFYSGFIGSFIAFVLDCIDKS